MSQDATKHITLYSKQNDCFVVDARNILKTSALVRETFDVKEDDIEEHLLSSTFEEPIPLLNVESPVLGKVIEFVNHYVQDPFSEIDKPIKTADMSQIVGQWYADYVKLDHAMLFDLVLAANYMEIKPLLELVVATISSMIKGKSPEEIRQTFNITNDFTPEEEAQVTEENKWCEDV